MSSHATTSSAVDRSVFISWYRRNRERSRAPLSLRESEGLEEKRLLDAALAMNSWGHRWVGPLMHDRIVGTLELCCRRGEMLLIQNKRIDWDTHTIGIPGHTAKDKENRRIPFDTNGRLAAILKRRNKLGPNAFVFGTDNGEFARSAVSVPSMAGESTDPQRERNQDRAVCAALASIR